MTARFLIRYVLLFLCCGILCVLGRAVVQTPHAFAQEAKGCEGVGFAKHPSKEYSPGALRRRLKQDPLDVDALVSLGIYLEEHGQVRQAVNLYDRAIKAKPNCDLGYYFAGLAEERVSEEMASDAQQKMCKAVNLNAHLQTYPNVVAYFGQHPLPGARAASGPTPSPPTLSDLLAHGNQFVMGMGAGLLLAALLVYAVGRKRGASS